MVAGIAIGIGLGMVIISIWGLEYVRHTVERTGKNTRR